MFAELFVLFKNGAIPCNFALLNDSKLVHPDSLCNMERVGNLYTQITKA